MAAKKSKMRRVPVKSGAGEKRRTIQFDYIKGNYFRVIHCDGITGSSSPGGQRINMSLFSERHPIPRSQTFEVDLNGHLAAEPQSVDARPAIVREVEATICMNIDMAKAMHRWLDAMLSAVSEIDGDTKKKATKKSRAK